MTRKWIVRFDDAKCVWKLQCPYCGWMFGFCLDLTGSPEPSSAVFMVDGRYRMPTQFPKKEGGRSFAYFQPRSRRCKRCGTLRVPDYELDTWLRNRGIKVLDYDELVEILLRKDPKGECARPGSDRVFDIQFQDWGVDGMPSRYLFIKNETVLQSLLRSSS